MSSSGTANCFLPLCVGLVGRDNSIHPNRKKSHTFFFQIVHKRVLDYVNPFEILQIGIQIPEKDVSVKTRTCQEFIQNIPCALQIRGQIPEVNRTIMSATYEERVVIGECKALNIGGVSPEGSNIFTSRYLPQTDRHFLQTCLPPCAGG